MLDISLSPEERLDFCKLSSIHNSHNQRPFESAANGFQQKIGNLTCTLIVEII